MRINLHCDGSYTIDQYHFVQNIITKFCPSDAPWGTPDFHDTPAPLDYVFTKSNRPTPEELVEISTKYPGLHFASAVCTLLYLSLGTRPDITWIVAKLSKACHNPGLQDYKALLWLLGYLRLHSDYAIKYYSDINESPISDICKKHNVNQYKILMFSDASWQDCPDTGRSTTGFKAFYRGGIVEWNSSVPTPVAMSSSESEYLAACTACMASSHLRMLLYDFENLGKENYNPEGTHEEKPNILLVDNKATVSISKNYKPTKKNRHIARRFHYVREGERSGEHKLEWIPAEDQLADDLTKTKTSIISKPHVERTLVKVPENFL